MGYGAQKTDSEGSALTSHKRGTFAGMTAEQGGAGVAIAGLAKFPTIRGTNAAFEHVDGLPNRKCRRAAPPSEPSDSARTGDERSIVLTL
jgi:hypothetical protein